MKDIRIREREEFSKYYKRHDLVNRYTMCSDCRRDRPNHEMILCSTESQVFHRCKECHDQREARIAAHALRVKREMPKLQLAEMHQRGPQTKFGREE
jgi:hypothetical protein